MTKPDGVRRSALFSQTRLYRYALWRAWGKEAQQPAPQRFVMFIGLNPSTADESTDDPTIRRCMRFALAWGFEAVCMTNLFAWRATRPEDLRRCAQPLGVDNNETLRGLAKQADKCIAAWGADGTYLGRDVFVRHQLLRHTKLYRLGLTKDGHPRHPLYLPSTATPQEWSPA